MQSLLYHAPGDLSNELTRARDFSQDSAVVRVHVVGGSNAAFLLGGMLAVTGNEVTARRGVSSLRMALPAGWVTANLREAPGGEGPPPDCVLVDEGEILRSAQEQGKGPPTLAVCSGNDARWARHEEALETCVALLDIVADRTVAEGQVHLELVEPSAVIVVRRRTSWARLLSPLRRHGFRVEEVSSVSGHEGALCVSRLLDLPVSLCNSTRETFLASGDGRRIAEAVLEEGLRTTDKAGIGLAHLSWNDPRDLAEALQRRPASFDAFRYTPGRRYPEALQVMWRGGEVRFAAHRSLVRRATELGVPADWTWRLLGLLPRVKRGGFFASPADLLRAVG